MNSTNLNKERRANEYKYRILCIDDESSNLKVLNAILGDSYRIFLAKSAHAGLSKAIELQPDLIILDVIMPGMSGFEMIVELRNNPAISHIPVIFISGLQSVEDEEKGLLLGGCDFIQKPFHHSIVKARVNTHIELVRQRNLLEKTANIDSLTGLCNRRKWDLDSRLVWQESLKYKTPLVIGICDIDYFKGYNDTYGHQKGDVALRAIANVLRRCLFNYKGHVYRCGGEEFYFYFPFIEGLDVQVVLNEITKTVLTLNIENKSSDILKALSISAGAVQVIPDNRNDLLSSIGEADRLLYLAKTKGRNTAEFSVL